MADANYIVNLILRARDETSRALESATAKIKAFEALTEESNRSRSKSAEEMQRISSRQIELTDKERAANQRLYNERIKNDKASLDALIKLQNATERYQRLLGDVNARESERKKALDDVSEAEKKLSDQIYETYKAQTKTTAGHARAHAARARQIAEEQALLRTAAQERERIDRQHITALEENARREARIFAERQKMGKTEAAAHIENAARMARADAERQRAGRIEAAAHVENAARMARADAERQKQGREESAAYVENAAREARADAERQKMGKVEADAYVENARRKARADDERQRAGRQEAAAYAEDARRRQRAMDDVQAMGRVEARAHAENQRRDDEERVRLERKIEDQHRMAREFAAAAAEVARARQERDNFRALPDAQRSNVQHIQVDADVGIAEAKLDRVYREAVKLDVLTVNVDVEAHIADFMAKMAIVRAAARDAERDSGGFKAFTSGLFGEIREGFRSSAGQIAAFDNLMRGAFTLAITVFLPQLVLLAGSAAGALLALASSAAQAGLALGGALVAGITQAIPVLGVIGAFIGRFKQVLDAAKQANLLQQQQAAKQGQNNKKLADTTDAVASAQDSLRGAHDRLAAAQRRVIESQNGIIDARRQAKRQLEDLIDAERRADLAARGAVLSQRDAQAALQQAIRTGGDVERAQLDLAGANLAVPESRTTLSRARVDATRAEDAGIEGAPGVVAAKQQFEDAKRSVVDAERAIEQAERGLNRARRSADLAGEANMAAAEKLAFLRSQLSGAENDMLDALLKLQVIGRKALQFITEPLIRATTGVVQRITSLLGDRRVLGPLRGLSSEIAKQGLLALKSFDNPQTGRQFLFFIAQARKNMTPLRQVMENLGHVLLNIGEAAAPSLNRILRLLSSLTKNFKESTAEGVKTGSLAKFFDKGVDALKSWVNLLGSIGRLFLAIMGPGGGAKEGTNIVEDMTKAINKFADSINDPTTKTSKFFRQFFAFSRQALHEVAPMFVSLGKALAGMFTPEGMDQIRGFVKVMTSIVIPVFVQFFGILGKVTTAVGHFAAQHPGLTKLIAQVIAVSLAFAVFSKLGAFLGPITGGVKFLAGHFTQLKAIVGSAGKAVFEFVARFGRVNGIITNLFRMSAGFRSVIGLFNPWYLLAGVVFLLLRRFGLLDDVLRGIKGGFNAFINSVKGPFAELKRSVSELVNAFGGEGGLMPVVKIIINTLVRILVPTLKILGQAIGEVIGAIFTALSGVIDIIAGILTLDFDKVIGGIGKVGKAILDGLLAPLKAIPKLVLNYFKQMIRMVGEFLGIASPSRKFREIGQSIIDGIVGALRGLGNLILKPFKAAWGLVKDLFDGAKDLGETVADRFVRGFKSLPNKLLEAVKGIGNALLNVGKEIGNWIRKGLEKIPGGKLILGAVGKITGLLFKAGGGPVPGSGEGDTVPAMLTPGEHVWTKAEVQRAGGHGVLFALRALFGGGGQGSGGKFAVGGAVGSSPRASEARISAAAEDKERAARWQAMWDSMMDTTRLSSRYIEDRIRTLRVNVTATIERLQRDFAHTWQDIEDSAKRHATNLFLGVRGSIQAMSGSVYSGMSYIGSATNTALRAFDASPIKLSISRPNAKAGGGWIGNAGERGQDSVHTVLGRGEAVLNWAHQKVVNSALWNQYGTTLDGLFKGTSAYHAGGPNTAMGFARGGNTGPGHSGAGFTPVWNFAKKKFGMSNFTGFDGHSMRSSSGNISDHFVHRALDMSNGVLTPQEDGLSNFFKNRLPQVVKQLIWRNVDQFRGFPIGGHEDHVHLAMHDQYAFDSSLMAKLISRASAGLSIADLIKGAIGDDVQVDHVDRLKVKGKEPIRTLIAKLMDKIRGAANKAIDSAANKLAPGSDVGPLHGEAYSGPLDHRFPRHFIDQASGHVQLSPSQVASLAQHAGLPGTQFAQIAHGESNYFPGVVQRDPGDGNVGYGLWQMTPHAWGVGSLAYKMMQKLGGVTEMLNPWKNAQMARYLYDAAGKTFAPWYGTKFLRAAQGGFPGIPQFAKGGEVPGGSGRPVPIIAHAGEWVLNSLQQGKLAAMMNTSVGKLRDLLGFTGGPGSFAGGGSPKAGARDPITALDVFEEIEKHEKQISEARGKNKDKEIAKENERHRKFMAHLDAEQKREAARFAAGGRNVRRGLRASRGEYTDPDIPPTEIPDILREISLVRRATRYLVSGSRWKKSLDKFFNNINTTAREGGLLDQLGEAIESNSTRMATGLALAQVGLRRVSGRVRGAISGLQSATPSADPNSIAQAELANAQATGADLGGLRRNTSTTISQLQNQIARVRRGGVSNDELKEYQRLIGLRNRLITNIDDLDAKIAKNKGDQYDAQLKVFQTQTENALRPVQRQGALAALAGRIANAFGDKGASAAAAQAQLDVVVQQRAVIQQRLAAAQAKAVRDPRWRAVADELQTQVDDMTGQIAEQIAAIQAAGIDAINNAFDREQSAVGRGQRIAEVLGNTGASRSFQQQAIDSMNNQINALSEQLPGLGNNPGLAQAVSDKIAELQASVVEATANLFAATVADFDKQISRSRTALDLRGRLNDLSERIGNRQSAASNRISLSRQTTDIARQEYSGLASLRDQAFAQGNLKVAEELGDRMAELNVVIQESVRTTQELITANRQLSIDILKGITDSRTGFIGTASDIFTKISEVTGRVMTPQLLSAAQRQRDVLTDAADHLEDQIKAALMDPDAPFGAFQSQVSRVLDDLKDAFENGPEAYANELSRENEEIARLLSQMPEAERNLFQSLIDGMSENTIALLDNTQTINQLLGLTNQPQTFSSSSWEWFREAIFNGMGDVLPQYQVPHAQTGGFVRKTGLMNLHAGELIVNPAMNPMAEGDINITVNEKEGRIDENYLAARLAFERKVARAR